MADAIDLQKLRALAGQALVAGALRALDEDDLYDDCGTFGVWS